MNALLAWYVVSSIFSAPDPGAAVAIVVPESAAERSATITRHLSDELEVPSLVITSTRALWTESALTDAPFELRIDVERGVVRVRRAEDGLLLVRSFVPAMATESPYAIAVVAAELFRLSRLRPEEVSLVVERRAAPPPLSVGLDVSAGLQLALSFGHEPPILAPKLGVDLVLTDPSDGDHSLVGIRFGGPGVVEDPLGATRLRYGRFDAALRLALGRVDGRYAFGGAVELGAAFTRIVATDVRGEVLGEVRRAPIWATAGLFLERKIAAGFGLRLSLGLGGVIGAADYLVADEVGFSEGSVRANGEVSGFWRWE